MRYAVQSASLRPQLDRHFGVAKMLSSRRSPQEPAAGIRDPLPLVPRCRAERPGGKPGLLGAESSVRDCALNKVLLLPRRRGKVLQVRAGQRAGELGPSVLGGAGVVHGKIDVQVLDGVWLGRVVSVLAHPSLAFEHMLVSSSSSG